MAPPVRNQAKLSGPIPEGWQLPAGLQRLNLSGTQLSGPIPEGWQLPAGLLRLDLSGTQLSGPVPMRWLWRLPTGLT